MYTKNNNLFYKISFHCLNHAYDNILSYYMDMERCCRKANSYRMTTNIVNGQFFTNSRTFTTNSCLDSISKMKTSLFLFLVTKFHVYLNCPSISIIWQYNLIIYQSSSMKWSKYWTENNGYLNSLRYSFKTPSTELISFESVMSASDLKSFWKFQKEA